MRKIVRGFSRSRDKADLALHPSAARRLGAVHRAVAPAFVTGHASGEGMVRAPIDPRSGGGPQKVFQSGSSPAQYANILRHWKDEEHLTFMARPQVDLTGKIFGRLTVLERLPIKIKGHVYWLCECTCGHPNKPGKKRRKNIQHSHLMNGTIRSCRQCNYYRRRSGPLKPNQRHGSVLNAEQVRAIREMYSTGTITQKELAHQFGVIPLTIFNIIHRKTWQNLDETKS